MRVAFFHDFGSFAITRGMDSHRIIGGIRFDPCIDLHCNNPSFGHGNYTCKYFLTDHHIAKKPQHVGVFHLVMKEGSDNFRQSSNRRIIKRIRAKGLEAVINGSAIADDKLHGSRVLRKLETFNVECDGVIANSMTAAIQNAQGKDTTCDFSGPDWAMYAIEFNLKGTNIEREEGSIDHRRDGAGWVVSRGVFAGKGL